MTRISTRVFVVFSFRTRSGLYNVVIFLTQATQTKRITTVRTNRQNTETPQKLDPNERTILLAVIGLLGTLFVAAVTGFGVYCKKYSNLKKMGKEHGSVDCVIYTPCHDTSQNIALLLKFGIFAN